jgi:hypothetical protein
MDLSHFSLPSWFVWLAGALGVITAVITIFQSVRVTNESETFDSVFRSLGEIIKRTARVVLPMLGIFVVVAACALCGDFAYSAYSDYVSKPQAQFSSSTYSCNSTYGHLYLKINNTTATAWQYAITIDDKDPAGAAWATVPQYATGLLELDDSLTIEVALSPQLCADMASYTQLELGATVTFTAAPPTATDMAGSPPTATSSGAKPKQIMERATLKIEPS